MSSLDAYVIQFSPSGKMLTWRLFFYMSLYNLVGVQGWELLDTKSEKMPSVQY